MNAPQTGKPGVLMKAQGSRHGEKVFVCLHGRRHWIRDPAWLAENGYRWPEDVQSVPAETLDALLPGQSASRHWSDDDLRNPPRRDTLEMREIALSRLHGSGIEVGAGANPMPVPLSCEVRYVDVFDAAELRRQIYLGQAVPDLIVPDIVAPFEDLSPIADSSVDFVVACHVIEHTRDPVGSIMGAWRKLRPGGHLALVVPEITRTFDRFRVLTPLAHLAEDYQVPDPARLRDQQHFREFYALALPAEPDEYEQVWHEQWRAAFPIHYHTWTHASFDQMLGWMSSSGLLPNVEQVWSQPPLDDPELCNEFWFVLTRGGDAA